MKNFLKYVAYSLLIVFLVTASLFTFKNHPEVQLAFLVPGVFIYILSRVADDFFKTHSKLRLSRSK